MSRLNWRVCSFICTAAFKCISEKKLVTFHVVSEWLLLPTCNEGAFTHTHTHTFIIIMSGETNVCTLMLVNIYFFYTSALRGI